MDQARADLSTTQAQLGVQFPQTDAALTVYVDPRTKVAYLCAALVEELQRQRVRDRADGT